VNQLTEPTLPHRTAFTGCVVRLRSARSINPTRNTRKQPEEQRTQEDRRAADRGRASRSDNANRSLVFAPNRELARVTGIVPPPCVARMAMTPIDCPSKSTDPDTESTTRATRSSILVMPGSARDTTNPRQGTNVRRPSWRRPRATGFRRMGDADPISPVAVGRRLAHLLPRAEPISFGLIEPPMEKIATDRSNDAGRGRRGVQDALAASRPASASASWTSDYRAARRWRESRGAAARPPQ
jgi:hypothetical protein